MKAGRLTQNNHVSNFIKCSSPPSAFTAVPFLAPNHASRPTHRVAAHPHPRRSPPPVTRRPRPAPAAIPPSPRQAPSSSPHARTRDARVACNPTKNLPRLVTPTTEPSPLPALAVFRIARPPIATLRIFAVLRTRMWRRRVRKNLVIDLIVRPNIVAHHRDRRITRPADHRCQRDIDHVVPEPPPVRPAARRPASSSRPPIP